MEMDQELIPFKETSGIWIVATLKIIWTDKAGLYSMPYSAGPIMPHVMFIFQLVKVQYINFFLCSSGNCSLICVLLACMYSCTCLHEI